MLVNPWAVPPPLLLLLMGLRPTHYPSLPSSSSDQAPSHRPAFNEKFAFDLDSVRPCIEDKLEVLFPRHLCKASLVTFIGLTAAGGAPEHQSIQTAPALVILPFIATVTSKEPCFVFPFIVETRLFLSISISLQGTQLCF